MLYCFNNSIAFWKSFLETIRVLRCLSTFFGTIIFSWQNSYSSNCMLLLIELTLCTCQNAKELLAQIRDHIWSLSDSNGIQIHNHLIRKRTINHYWVITTALSCEYLSVYCIWLYVIVLSRTIFRVNLHSILAWISRNSLHKAGAISEV